MTGEGSDDTKSSPEFDQRDQMSGTKDFVYPQHIMEEGRPKSPNLTPTSPLSRATQRPRGNQSNRKVPAREKQNLIKLQIVMTDLPMMRS